MGLVVADLSCQRNGRAVLDRLSFAAESGTALLLKGPNGAGKSTLLRVLAGLLPFVGGSAALDGAPLGSDSDAWAEAIAYAGHLDAIKPQLTVRENLAFWGALFGGTPAAEERAIEGFALAQIADRPAHACSAGQKRRLGLARLLLVPRRLWLLDEPTVSLDVDAVARVSALVREHCRGGGVALIATHVDLDLPDARELRLVPPARRARVSTDPFLAGFDA